MGHKVQELKLLSVAQSNVAMAGIEFLWYLPHLLFGDQHRLVYVQPLTKLWSNYS